MNLSSAVAPITYNEESHGLSTPNKSNVKSDTLESDEQLQVISEHKQVEKSSYLEVGALGKQLQRWIMMVESDGQDKEMDEYTDYASDDNSDRDDGFNNHRKYARLRHSTVFWDTQLGNSSTS